MSRTVVAFSVAGLYVLAVTAPVFWGPFVAWLRACWRAVQQRRAWLDEWRRIWEVSGGEPA